MRGGLRLGTWRDDRKKVGEKRKRHTGDEEGNEEIGACENGRQFAQLKGVG